MAGPPRRVRRDGGRRAAPTPRCCRPRSSSPTTRPRPSARASTPSPAAAAPRPAAQVSRAVEVRHRGQAYRIVVAQLAPGRYRADVDGTAVEADVERLSGHERRITIAGVTHRTMISRQGADLLVEVHGVPHRITRDDGGFVRSPGPVRGRRDPGLRGRRGGRGRRRRGRRVDEDGDVADRAVRRPRPPRADRHQRAGPRAHAAAAARGDRGRGRRAVRRARRASPPRPVDAATVRAPRSTACAGCCSATTSPATRSAARWPRCASAEHDAELLAGEHRLLDVFTDVRALSRARHDPERELLHSPQEYLHAFLRSLDAKAERLPERFVTLLAARALALRRREPGPHARARGGVLPPVRLPGARRPAPAPP